MSSIKVAFAFCVIISVSFKDVFSWTIDLPEARTFYFEKVSKSTKNENVTPVIEEDKTFYDNINPNSRYHEDYEPKVTEYEESAYHEGGDEQNDIYHGRYADDYDYQSYMEKKVHSIVHNGTLYLEGLQKALYRYSELLRNCSKYNFDEPQPAANSTNTTWLPQNEAPVPAPHNSTRATCARVTESSEHVRRLAELALWATRELQDRAYADKYESKNEEYEEEKELLLRLAWFLDRLATLTGFEPDPRDFVSDAPPTETTPNLSTSPSTTTECNPGANTCRFPLSMPASSTSTGTQPTRTQSTGTQPTATQPTRTQPTRTQPTRTQPTATRPKRTQPTRTQPITETATSSETLIPSESRHLSEIPPKRSSVRSVQKRSISDHPLMNVIKYYTKHKVWVNSNPGSVTKEEITDFSVPNDIVIKTIKKRAVENKKYKHLQLPENPMQDISNYSKKKPGLNYTKDKMQAEKIREFLKKIRLHSLHIKPKKSVQKRSTHYEKMFLPRVPQDPHQDLSYYAKNRQGTNPTFNLVQAAQVREGLEQVFQTGNIEVIRRFGTNYNPAIPNPLMGGVLRTFVDS